MKKEKSTSIEVCNGFTLIGPTKNFEVAKKMTKEMEKEMKSTYKEYKKFSGESGAMDARDDVFFDDYEDKFKGIGFVLSD